MLTFKTFLAKPSTTFKRRPFQKGQKKGGYPYGTKKNQGGLPVSFGMGMNLSGDSGDGGIGESFLATLLHEQQFDRGDDPAPKEYSSPDSDSDSIKSIESTDDDPEQPEDPDRQGLLRHVPGAHLVYKRQSPEGTYDEMWIYDISHGINDEFELKSAILAGTDIDLTTGASEDGEQQYDIWTIGNAQILTITGLPN